jgi:carbon storage regulator
MLALARTEGQSIIIDGNIEVKVVKWSRSSVRLAIQAPREVTVDRDEVWRKMHPGEMTPLEKAEKERNERFAREGYTLVAPEAGTFYATAVPGGAPLVTIGTTVKPDSLVGTIKTADATHELHAKVHGTVIKILATSGQPVTAGQVLISIKPSGS